MNVIQDFESKLKIIGGEKVYSAREIMKTFGYDKWERFVGAINRAKDEIQDDKKRDENFMFIVNKSTGGRPREDVMLSLGACYLVLKKCDGRKNNITILRKYLSGIIELKKEERIVRKQYISFQNIFFIILIVLVFITFVYYLITYFYFSFIQNISYDFRDTYKEEYKSEALKQEQVFKAYDIKNNILDTKIASGGNVKINNQLSSSFTGLLLSDYISLGEKKMSFFQSGYNLRSPFLEKISSIDLIAAYFLLGNQNLFRDSCSLLSPKYCLSTSKGNLNEFSNFWQKTLAGYEILSLKKVKMEANKNIYCVSYKYKLKNDLSQKDIVEVFNYTTQVTNNYEQITGRFCEKIEKGGKNIACPFQLKTYYCK